MRPSLVLRALFSLARAARSAMTRVLLLAVLAAALVAHANAALPTTCPDNGAKLCKYGVKMGDTVVLPTNGQLMAMNVSDLITLQNTVGNFAVGSVGLCSSISFTCGTALQTLNSISPGLVRGFAGACFPPPGTTFLVSNVTYTAYGTFIKSDCQILLTGLATTMLVPSMAALVTQAVPHMTVCGSDYCTTETSGAGRGAPARAALLVAALAAAAALL